MKQVEKDQRSSNEFSMRLEITASIFPAAPLFSVLCNRCAAQNPFFRLFAVLSPSLHPGVSFSLFLNSSVSLCNVLRGFFHFNHCYFAFFFQPKAVGFFFIHSDSSTNQLKNIVCHFVWRSIGSFPFASRKNMNTQYSEAHRTSNRNG